MSTKFQPNSPIIRIALSGAAGTGKTSLIDALERRGHAVFHEYSRQLIQESLAKGSDVLPWDNLDAFTDAVLATRWQHYCAAEGRNSVVFYDRSPMDALAYYGPDPSSWHSDWMAVCERSVYSRVFVTPPWREIYTVDQERWETFEHVEEVHAHLVATYRHFGYEPVLVPFGTLEDRVEFIESHLAPESVKA
jgi:predicted ATPase